MNESGLRAVMNSLGVQVGPRTAKGWMNGSCPLAQWKHKNGSDRSPSFGVFANDKGRSTYFCQGCKSKGTISNLIQQLSSYRSIDYTTLSERIAATEVAGTYIPDFEEPLFEDDTPLPLDEAMWEGLFEPIEDHREAARFMVKRRVSRATCHKLGIQYDPDDRRIIFPVRGAEGELYGFSGRSIVPDAKIKVKDYAGLPKRHLILGRERWREGLPVAIVEGLFAYARWHEEGIEDIANIGALLGSYMTPEKAAVINAFGHATFLCLDPDEAGDHGTFGIWDEALKRVKVEESAVGQLWGEVPIFVPEFPEGLDDVDDLTKGDVAAMFAETPLWSPDPRQLRILRGDFGKGTKGKGNYKK